MDAFVGRSVFVPRNAVDVAAICKKLTVRTFGMGAEEATITYAYALHDDYLEVPRAFGLQLIANLGLSFSDERSKGKAFRFPRRVEHVGDYAYQKDFVGNILASAKSSSDFLVEAATGKGKTVCSLSVIQKLGRTALVLVDQENLLQQWMQQAQKVLGLRADQIGRVQGEVCDYEGKGVVIAMIQSLTQREYPDAFYEYFGTVVVDEVHTVGAPTFSRTLMMFSAYVRFGVSATIKRSDALQKIINWNLGEVEVSLTDTHDTSYAYYMESGTVYSWYANISSKVGRILMEVTEDTDRNLLLVEAITFLHGTGRDVLVVSDRIEQLEALMAMCYYTGVPDADMGLYCGYRSRWMYEKEAKPKRRPDGYRRGTEYTPVKLTPVRKRNPKKGLAVVKETSRIVFATFGMFSKGVDEPRLNGGVDCSPRSKAKQVHGRLLRVVDNKLVPIWITIRDYNSYRLEYQFVQRLVEYIEDSAEVYEWIPSKGVLFRDARALKREVHDRVAELKALNVITQLDGRCTLVTPPTPVGQGKPPATRTGRTTR